MMIDSLQREVKALREEVQDLRAQLGRNSSNSSKPPSSDPPWKPPAERRKPGKRKRGGQPGHGGHERATVTPDVVVDVKPPICVHCGDGLAGEDVEPWRHQVSEVPRVCAEVTEYRLHTLGCASCGKDTRAPWPEGVPQGAFGPRLAAIVAVCSGAYHLSKRNIEDLVHDFFGVEISLGSVSNLEAAASEALAAPYAEALAHVQRASVVHADETGWYQASKLTWLWIAVTKTVAVFMLRATRAAAVAQELLGSKFAGVLVTDGYNGYHWFSGRRRQLCWAHLIRSFCGLLEWPTAKVFGERLLDFSERLFHEWHQIRDGTSSRAQFVVALAPLKEELSNLLAEGASSSHRRVRALCKTLTKHEQSLWLFAHRLGVEPTNNAAERALRRAVIWRKTSFGTDSERGSLFVERVLTVVTTLRLRQRNVLEFVTDACRAAQCRLPAPSLLAEG